MSRDAEWRWWCMCCCAYTDRSPCEHCKAGQDEIAVVEPGCAPPSTEQECDEAATIDYYDWPESAYG